MRTRPLRTRATPLPAPARCAHTYAARDRARWLSCALHITLICRSSHSSTGSWSSCAAALRRRQRRQMVFAEGEIFANFARRARSPIPSNPFQLTCTRAPPVCPAGKSSSDGIKVLLRLLAASCVGLVDPMLAISLEVVHFCGVQAQNGGCMPRARRPSALRGVRAAYAARAGGEGVQPCGCHVDRDRVMPFFVLLIACNPDVFFSEIAHEAHEPPVPGPGPWAYL